MLVNAWCDGFDAVDAVQILCNIYIYIYIEEHKCTKKYKIQTVELNGIEQEVVVELNWVHLYSSCNPVGFC